MNQKIIHVRKENAYDFGKFVSGNTCKQICVVRDSITDQEYIICASEETMASELLISGAHFLKISAPVIHTEGVYKLKGEKRYLVSDVVIFHQVYFPSTEFQNKQIDKYPELFV